MHLIETEIRKRKASQREIIVEKYTKIIFHFVYILVKYVAIAEEPVGKYI
jgi:hypothetical protein